eukprot:Lithocolla_globosa_v1_NODE_555_length_3757_cov_87.131821.p3 type:complete len:167 gc:universal NODE_555_length_3757_cov_87.131821:2303-1803(-)
MSIKVQSKGFVGRGGHCALVCVTGTVRHVDQVSGAEIRVAVAIRTDKLNICHVFFGSIPSFGRLLVIVPSVTIFLSVTRTATLKSNGEQRAAGIGTEVVTGRRSIVTVATSIGCIWKIVQSVLRKRRSQQRSQQHFLPTDRFVYVPRPDPFFNRRVPKGNKGVIGC